MQPERDALEITFPRVEGYRVELPEERLTAKFDRDSVLELTPELVGPSVTKNQGIVGEGVELTIAHLDDMRPIDDPVPPRPGSCSTRNSAIPAKSRRCTCSAS